jgi:predicted nucleotidyltransferase
LPLNIFSDLSAFWMIRLSRQAQRGCEPPKEKMNLWEIIEQKRSRQREQVRRSTLTALKEAVAELLPSQRCVVFGSLLQPGRFHDKSDVDLALWDTPPGLSEYRLQAALEERLHRPVDLVLLPESRLREKILREGELWTNSD